MISCAQVSYKRQHYAARLRKFTKTVLDLFQLCINDRLNERLFRLLVLKPLRMESLYELPVVSLSGGIHPMTYQFLTFGISALRTCYLTYRPGIWRISRRLAYQPGF